MRALPVAVIAIVLGAVVGIASAYWTVGPQHSAADIAVLRGGPSAEALDLPMFAADSTTYNFGAMQRGTSKEHAFKVTNEGTRPLMVEVLSTTCKCTVGDVSGEPILPGETVDVTLNWVAKTAPGDFRQTATLKTNDPRRRREELTVEGTVTDVSGVEPREWFFDEFRPGESRTESVYVMSYHSDDLKVSSAELDHEDAKDEYEVKVVEVPKDELPDAAAKAGVRVDVTPLANVALGPMQDWVVLKTNIEGAEELRVPILGNAVGDIEIRGPAAWNEVTGAIHFGNIQSEEGEEVKLFVSIKGDHVSDVKLEVVEKDPEQLEIELGELKRLKPGSAMVPMTVRVPKGLPPAIRNGSGMGEAGHVVLKTNHPLNPEISFGVRYVIKGASITK